MTLTIRHIAAAIIIVFHLPFSERPAALGHTSNHIRATLRGAADIYYLCNFFPNVYIIPRAGGYHGESENG